MPTISSMIRSGVNSAIGALQTVTPSRKMVSSSTRPITSSSRCETKIVATPWSRSRLITVKSAPAWSSVSELVGSSRMRMRASVASTRAISTICCWSGRSLLTGQAGS